MGTLYNEQKQVLTNMISSSPFFGVMLLTSEQERERHIAFFGWFWKRESSWKDRRQHIAVVPIFLENCKAVGQCWRYEEHVRFNRSIYVSKEDQDEQTWYTWHLLLVFWSWSWQQRRRTLYLIVMCFEDQWKVEARMAREGHAIVLGVLLEDNGRGNVETHSSWRRGKIFILWDWAGTEDHCLEDIALSVHVRDWQRMADIRLQFPQFRT